jgi:hypothetical protein
LGNNAGKDIGRMIWQKDKTILHSNVFFASISAKVSPFENDFPL